MGGGIAHTIKTEGGYRPDSNFIIEQSGKDGREIDERCKYSNGERLQRVWQSSDERSIRVEEIKCEQVATLQGGKWDKMHDIAKRVYGTNGISPTLHTCGGGEFRTKDYGRK